MTEQTMAFGSTTLAEPPAPLVPTGFDEQDDDNSKRKLAVVGAVAAVVVVLIAAFFLMRGGSGATESGGPAPHPVTATAGAATTPAGAAHKAVKLPKSFDGQVGRDPFKVLYHLPAAKVATGDGAAAGTPGTTPLPVVGVPGTGTVPTTGGTVPTTGSTGSASGAPAGYAPAWVELVRVNGTQSATFVVGYTNGQKSTTVKYADVQAPSNSTRTVFAGVFSLLSIQNGTVTVQLGDGTPFDLNSGFSNRHFVG